MKRVYVAGPYTKGDQVINVANAIDAANKLLDAGFAPFCPHLSMLWHLRHPRPWADWIEMDLEWVKVSDAVLRLPGESQGADCEVAHAGVFDIPVFTNIDELIKAMG